MHKQKETHCPVPVLVAYRMEHLPNNCGSTVIRTVERNITVQQCDIKPWCQCVCRMFIWLSGYFRIFFLWWRISRISSPTCCDSFTCFRHLRCHSDFYTFGRNREMDWLVSTFIQSRPLRRSHFVGGYCMQESIYCWQRDCRDAQHSTLFTKLKLQHWKQKDLYLG